MNIVRILLATLLLSHSLHAATPPPNFVIIFIDDMGYGDIGPFGATKQKTPNLNRMASEGMKLTSFYAAPVCSVSRAQMMTGCYGARVSVPGVFSPASRAGLNPAEHTIAERLKEHGYATMCVGKWHLGDQPEFLPIRQGFDHYFGIPYSNDMQRKSLPDGANVVPLVRDDKVQELLNEDDQSRIVERYTDEAIKFIRSSKEQPFFLYLPHTAVHTPIHPGAAFAGKSNNGRFGDWVEEVDWSTGRILDTLRELKLAENTFVLFTSDNGPWLIKGSDGGSAGPLRGGKGSTWEGGVRVPTIAWWPGKISAGSTCDTVAGTIDVLPTLVSLAGSSLPAEPVIDGRDMSPLLLKESKTSPREAHYYFSSYNLQAVRQGPWKLAIATQPETMGKQPADDAKTNPRLYNLAEEIGEHTNLADQHPEIVAKLQALIAAKAAEIGGQSPTARRPAGETLEPKTLYPSQPQSSRKKPKANKKAKSAAASLDQLKPGETLAAEAAPQVAGTAFTLSCDVETTQKDAILIAHGGAAVGYSLYLRDHHLVFAIRTGTKNGLHEIASAKPLEGRCHIAASFTDDLSMTLSINDQIAASGKTTSALLRQPQEDFCVGHDNQKPLLEYPAQEDFKGILEHIKITFP
ncbi:MAG: sulfatase-like hydrolase/transferase [Verrucomicrobiaceae bacterium]|nr:sulfatase-like hydrolase/transferase [Verrucomicrobiaceae bacterium]